MEAFLNPRLLHFLSKTWQLRFNVPRTFWSVPARFPWIVTLGSGCWYSWVWDLSWMPQKKGHPNSSCAHMWGVDQEESSLVPGKCWFLLLSPYKTKTALGLFLRNQSTMSINVCTTAGEMDEFFSNYGRQKFLFFFFSLLFLLFPLLFLSFIFLF